ncbi:MULTISPECIES: ABC transporter ATP-binding protein [Roseovarius]|jgi:branched-chain amino acid transport system ATP-binding protein/neutral amino acid transport system ATP-binding protein|uniref:ABC transporter ATP-binding protein n=1 Tax=Roseovarius nubinhibens TaxID=314263 RepID=A0A348W9V9_9RHOB|nr:ABC transporter ATP-binding protein [Roseovarius nubinhibens]|tara:strand:+ start:1318 stop:2034 length:717 start_codon:yes stop_codon:yes gene_type:complete
MSDALLKTRALQSGYGKTIICHDVTLDLAPGEITCIIGPNGAGKSTLLKTIAGVVRPVSGSVTVAGREIAGLPAAQVARSGMAYVPQEANVFRQLTTHENLTMGSWGDKTRTQEACDRIYEMFPDLARLRQTRAGNLSGGQRQMVAFGMALMLAPKVLLLDEPSAGLSPLMVGQMFDIVQRVNGEGVAILMVEQNAIQGLRIADHGIVMAAGRVALQDKASNLLASKEVSELYLGSRS